MANVKEITLHGKTVLAFLCCLVHYWVVQQLNMQFYAVTLVQHLSHQPVPLVFLSHLLFWPFFLSCFLILSLVYLLHKITARSTSIITIKQVMPTLLLVSSAWILCSRYYHFHHQRKIRACIFPHREIRCNLNANHEFYCMAIVDSCAITESQHDKKHGIVLKFGTSLPFDTSLKFRKIVELDPTKYQIIWLSVIQQEPLSWHKGLLM